MILSVLGERCSPESELAASLPQARAPMHLQVFAVIPVVGSPRSSHHGLEPASGFTSYAEITGMVDAAISDPSVEGILLDIDSPGGESRRRL